MAEAVSRRDRIADTPYRDIADRRQQPDTAQKHRIGYNRPRARQFTPLVTVVTTGFGAIASAPTTCRAGRVVLDLSRPATCGQSFFHQPSGRATCWKTRYEHVELPEA